MRLKRLELQGFKSFSDRTILTFQPGITGVVGPNGCGKSNIVDAILWVMGEQSPKHLRGESMTDIIFNGSENKNPTSMAEVSLVLDKQGVPLHPQFAIFDKNDEISITRRIFRDGTGEFMINKIACRLRDIHELFMDTGVGRRAYSIIEQGQIDRMINVKPEERRALFEEVAGITKYKIKRREAEKKLELTRGNILRLQDIVNELEKQMRSLKVQASRARKFRELKVELEAADLFLLGRNLYVHKKRIDEFQVRRTELVDARSELEADFSQSNAHVTELDILRIDQEKEFQRLNELERSISARIVKLESDISLADERRKFLNETKDQAAAEEIELSTRTEELEIEEEKTIREREDLDGNLELLDTTIREQEETVKSSGDVKSKLTHQKDSLQRQISQLSQKEMQLTHQKESGESKEQDLRDARLDLDEKLSEVVIILEVNKQNVREADQKIETCLRQSQKAEQETSAIYSEVETTSQKLSEVEDLVFKSREKFHATGSRLQSLKELQQNLEGYSPSAREILLALGESKIEAVPLAEILQPEVDIEDHLEKLLGSDMNTLIVGTGEEAQALTTLINSRDLEQVKILALSELDGLTESQGAPPSATALISKIKVTTGYEKVAAWCFNQVYLCGNAEDVFAKRQAFPEFTFVSSDCRTIAHDDRALSAGLLPTKTGVFARKREIEELQSALQAIESEMAELNSRRDSLMALLENQEHAHSQLKDKLSSLHIESVEYRKEKEKIQLELNRTERDFANLSRDAERLTSQTEELLRQVETWGEELLSLSEQRESLTIQVGEVEIELAENINEFERLRTAINEQKIERSKFGERVNSIEFKIERILSEKDQVAHRWNNLKVQRARDEKELESIDDRQNESRTLRTDVLENRNQTLVHISDAKEAFNLTCEKLQGLRERKDLLQKQLQSVLTEMQDVEVKLTQEQSSFEHVRGISLERYNHEAAALDESTTIDLEKLPMLTATLDTPWDAFDSAAQQGLLAEHVKSIREKVSRYGEVNLTAIQEFDEIQKRFEFLTAQREDLDSSIRILEEAIVKIDESTKTRFEDTFHAVNKKFKEIFPVLFNGGKAELALTNEENMLEAGVDVLVQPPGKRLQSMSLLSGGEKALTAVSLILSIFARKPSPFCLLDEVDAPLDDANVSRFNTVIRKMSEKTQFIVITHNKKTMEIAEALYGVTMERAGVSKMTSVRLN
jgi:chromosome segregation protein